MNARCPISAMFGHLGLPHQLSFIDTVAMRQERPLCDDLMSRHVHGFSHLNCLLQVHTQYFSLFGCCKTNHFLLFSFFASKHFPVTLPFCIINILLGFSSQTSWHFHLEIAGRCRHHFNAVMSSVILWFWKSNIFLVRVKTNPFTREQPCAFTNYMLEVKGQKMSTWTMTASLTKCF